MTKGRDNLAEALNGVLESVRLRRQTGLLSIECLREGRYEEGEIYVQAGQPVYAQTGQLSGQEAFTRMLGWRQIQFAFLPDVVRAAANSAFPKANGNTPSPPVSTITAPRFPAMNGSGPMQAVEWKSGPLPAQDAPQVPQEPASIPGLEWIVPRKVGSERDVMGLPLTRPQRSVYLLVDGRRSVADLARCTRKSMQEIERLLSELRERGLITI
jgi:hypothetical protein